MPWSGVLVGRFAVGDADFPETLSDRIAHPSVRMAFRILVYELEFYPIAAVRFGVLRATVVRLVRR